MSGQLDVVVHLYVEGDVDEFATIFAQYLTEVGYPFEEDYGPKAWGGYEGPYVRDVAVSRNGLVLESATFPPRESEEEE